MQVPFKPVYLPRGPRRYHYIVLHDTNCMCKAFNDFKVDRVQYQTNRLRERLRQDRKLFELPFHYVCEKVMDDYMTSVARPVQYSCEDVFQDLDYKFSRYAIHICVMGNFNTITGTTRMYQQLCYRAIAPVMKTYRIPKANIFLHGELNSQSLDCPGFNFSKQHLLAYLPPFLITQTS